MKRFALSSLAFVLFAAACLGDEPKTANHDKEATTADQPMSYWMEKKLDYSQSLLRGLASGDFESIKLNAAQLHLLNKVEGFVRGRNVDYRHHVHTFERVTNEIVRQAERENMEGVTLAFNQLTISCVNCHQTLRDIETNGKGEQE